MVTLTGELVSPLLVFFIPLMVLLFAFREEIKQIRKFFYGMTYGIGTYGSLLLASYTNNPKTDLGAWAHFFATVEGSMIYVSLIGIIGTIALMEFLLKKQASGFIAGVVVSFTIFEVYFAMRCVETIPFMEDVLRHQCV